MNIRFVFLGISNTINEINHLVCRANAGLIELLLKPILTVCSVYRLA
jgi:hypothetical protein